MLWLTGFMNKDRNDVVFYQMNHSLITVRFWLVVCVRKAGRNVKIDHFDSIDASGKQAEPSKSSAVPLAIRRFDHWDFCVDLLGAGVLPWIAQALHGGIKGTQKIQEGGKPKDGKGRPCGADLKVFWWGHAWWRAKVCHCMNWAFVWESGICVGIGRLLQVGRSGQLAVIRNVVVVVPISSFVRGAMPYSDTSCICSLFPGHGRHSVGVSLALHFSNPVGRIGVHHGFVMMSCMCNV